MDTESPDKAPDAKFFSRLHGQELALFKQPELGIKRDGVWFVLLLVGMVLALAPAVVPMAGPVLIIVRLGALVLQLLALAIISYRQLRDVVPDFIDAKCKFARELDLHSAATATLIEDLHEYPLPVLTDKLAYLEARLEALRTRYAMLFGAVDKLGVLPVLAALFLQARGIEMKWSPQLMLGLGIAAFYSLGLWVSRFRLQMESYARLIRAAINTRR